ncbi:solute carrier organic anion transporter [Deinococcus psychrotolerans]|nr:solute carrier organic anion transporter [Deinococcus psychrotolerans]
MNQRHKNTPNRRKKPIKPELIVKIILALSSLMMGLAALLTALRH